MLMIPVRHRSYRVMAWLLAAMLLSAMSMILLASPLRVLTPLAPEVKTLRLALMRQDVGLQERTGRNDHPKIDAWLALSGAPKGSPWCYAVIWAKTDSACRLLGQANPLLRTASTQTAFSAALKSYGARSGSPHKGDIVIWRIPRTWLGHAALVEEVKGARLVTLEGNTSRGTVGDQRNGGGLWRRSRYITRAMGRLVIRGFIS